MSDVDLAVLRDQLFTYISRFEPSGMGVCNRESLAGGPPSSDLTRELEGARSALVFALPLDQDKLEAYMAKLDHESHQDDNIKTNTLVQGIASEVANALSHAGFVSAPVNAGNTPPMDSRDPSPQGEAQVAAAARYPAGPGQQLMGAIPILSQRFLAAAAGVGFFGMSGNILTESHGAAVVLGAVVTTADLPPTPPLPPEANYCDECNWCGSVCPTQFMSRTEFDRVELGGRTHQYSKRMHPARCAAHMMGVTGLAPDGKWGSWGPGRVQLPDDDESVLPAMMKAGMAAAGRPAAPGSFTFPHDGRPANIMCSACNLVCHPEREVRARRVKLWRQGGVSVQHEDGRIETLPADEAKAFVEALPPERRALYESVGDYEDVGD